MLTAPQRAPLVPEPPQSGGTRGLRGRGGGPIPILLRPRPVLQPWQRAAAVTHELRLCRPSHSSRCCSPPASPPPLPVCLAGWGKILFGLSVSLLGPGGGGCARSPPPSAPTCPGALRLAAPGTARRGRGWHRDARTMCHHLATTPALPWVSFFSLKRLTGILGAPRQSPWSGAGGAGGTGPLVVGGRGFGWGVPEGGAKPGGWIRPWPRGEQVGERRGGWGGTDPP